MILRTEPERRAAGFTLIEMIIVLVVLGLAAAILISRGPVRSPAVELRSVATGMLQGMRATRAEAIATDKVTSFSLDAAGHGYRVGQGASQPVPVQVAAQLTVGGKPARAIGFAPDGSSTGGEVLLADANRRMTVTVDWLTGRMRVQEVAP